MRSSLLTALIITLIVISGVIVNLMPSNPVHATKEVKTPAFHVVQSKNRFLQVYTPPKHALIHGKFYEKNAPNLEIKNNDIKRVKIENLKIDTSFLSLQVKYKKYNPALTENVLKKSSTSFPIRVKVYIKPSYLKGKDFTDALKEISRKIESRGIKVISAEANPLIVEVSSKEQLDDLSRMEFVSYIKRAFVAGATLAGSVESEGTYVISANYAWDKGFIGQGINVGVVEPFSYGGFVNYQSLVSQGELPVNTNLYSPNGIGVNSHGSAVAEILYDTAPGISGMYLGVYSSTIDLYNLVNWFIENNVKVLTHSAAVFEWDPAMLDSDNDGNAEFWDIYKIVEYAVGNGIVWVNGAGDYRYTHWEGSWSDRDNDNILDIYGNPSDSDSIELNREVIQVILKYSTSPVFRAWIRWNDYPYPSNAPTNDFDAYLSCWNSSQLSWEIVAYSEDYQDGSFGEEPLEFIEYKIPNDGQEHYCALFVAEYNAPDAGSMNFDIWLEGIDGYWLLVGFGNFNYIVRWNPLWSSRYNPVVEEGSIVPPSDSPLVISVGATSVTDPSVLSSQTSFGPSDEGLIKPDLVAPDGISTLTYPLFYGTSASAPHVAGVVADVLSALPSLSPSAVKWILEKTAKDLGNQGKDVYYGSGLINASDATPQRLIWLYPTPEPNAVIDVSNVVINMTSMYKVLDEANLTVNGETFQMTQDSSSKEWSYSLSSLSDGTYKYSVTTLDSYNVWIVSTAGRNFTVNTQPLEYNSEIIDGDGSTGWIDSSLIPSESSKIMDGVFVWKDALNDGFTSECTGLSYDISELQLRADSGYFYILIRLSNISNYGKPPAPIVGVGFDVDNDGKVDYTAYAFLDKVGVSEASAEHLDIYDSSWKNVALNDPTHAVFIANGNVIEMQIPKAVLDNPSGSIGVSAWIYEGLGAGRICTGYDELTNSGDNMVTVDLTAVPFFSNMIFVIMLLLLSFWFVRRT